MSKIWPCQRIEQAIGDGMIQSAMAVSDRQIQPASLDMRLGGMAWRTEASFLPGRGHTVGGRLAEMDAHRIDLIDGFVMERGTVYVARLAENLRLPSGTSAKANPKSTTGRLDIFVRLLTDEGERFDEVPEGYEGPLYVEMAPRSFPVLVRRGTTLNQIRIREGAPSGPTRVQHLTADLSCAEGGSGPCGYRARRTSGVIDLGKVGAYPRRNFWDEVPSGRNLVMDTEELYILRSAEDVVASPTEAAEVVAFDAALGELRNHAAGFIDPGFGAPEADANGAKLVFEARCTGVPFLVRHGQTMATVNFEDMLERPRRLYGAAGSSYQGQGLRLAKQFS